MRPISGARLARTVPSRQNTLLLVLLPLFASLACGGSSETEGGPSPTSIVLSDTNNYSLQSSLAIPTVETASGTDLDICWTNVVSDLQCHALAPQADLDTVGLLRFLGLGEDEVEAKLTSGQLSMSEVAGYLAYETDHTSTCAKLSSLSFFGTPIQILEQYRESPDYTYMLLFAEGTTPGVGARAMTFVKPTAGSTNTRVDAPSGCGLLDVTADLSSAERVSLPAEGPWVVDWRNVTRDGQGNEIVFESIDGVLLGFYAGMTVPDLEAGILDLELMATSLWEVRLTGGRTADLASARARGENIPFPGFARDEAGVWAMGLMCSTCQNPAPVVLSILEPSAATP
jgi:hypothetical protein